MKRRPSLTLTVCTAALLAFGSAVVAQGTGSGAGSGPGMMMGRGGMGQGMGMGMMGGCPMMGGMMGGSGGKMAAHAEGRVAFLKAELAITEAQQAAWTTYADALRKNLANMQGMHETMMQAMSAKSAIGRLEAHIAAMEGRLASLKEVKAPLAALYAALSDEQKQKADDLLTGMGCMM